MMFSTVVQYKSINFDMKLSSWGFVVFLFCKLLPQSTTLDPKSSQVLHKLLQTDKSLKDGCNTISLLLGWFKAMTKPLSHWKLFSYS